MVSTCVDSGPPRQAAAIRFLRELLLFGCREGRENYRNRQRCIFVVMIKSVLMLRVWI
jgi:hypothetical protein